MANVPYQIYKTNVNGRDAFSIMPATNTPYGYQVSNPAEVVKAAQDELKSIKARTGGAASFETNYYKNQFNQLGGDAALAKLQAIDPNNIKPEDINVLSPLQPGVFNKSISAYAFTPQQFIDLSHGGPPPSSDISWGKDPLSGQYGWGDWDKFNADEAKHAAAVAAGTEKKVPMGNGGYSYVPTGSAADQLLTNPPPPQPTGIPSANNPSTPVTGTSGQPAQIAPVGGASVIPRQAAPNSVVTPTAPAQNNLQAALQIIQNDSKLDAGQKAYFSQIASNYDFSTEFDPQKVIDAVKKVETSTIDPYFQEQGNIIKDNISRATTAAQQARGLETQQEGMNAQQAIKGASNSLEASGLSQSGEGIRLLGGQSAYAQAGNPQAQQSAMPVQQPFGGKFAEGLVNQSNRLISSSSSNRYQQNLTDLSRQAEQQLGSAGSAGLVPGVAQMGNVTGNLPNQKTQALSTEFNNQYNLQAQKNQTEAPLNVLS